MLIDGHTFAGMLISAANALDNNKTAINNMNVFPVPDGDTGINMTLTMSTVKALKDFDGTISDCADRMASMVLRAARGNSGAILSLFFRGMSKALKGLDKADSIDFANAFKKGTEEAYKAVMKPTEGTILTVMRMCSERIVSVADSKYRGDVVGLFTYILKIAEKALSKTPDMLPILKEVNVVDAGGYGFVTVISGMLDALNNKPVMPREIIVGKVVDERADFDSFSDEDITFTYCTEAIVDKSEAHVGNDKCAALREFIGSIGDSVVFAEDDTMVKFHIHTDHPGLVIEKALEFGSIATMKVENMRNQHSEMAKASNKESKQPEVKMPVKKYGFVTVCMGGGISDTFRDLGADYIIYGGQTMNPSTQDIIDGINSTPAEIVYVLPNNKNIYLVALQAAKLVTDKQIEVLNTHSVPEGVAAMLSFDENASVEENNEAMGAAISSVVSMSVTYAVRDTHVDGIEIWEGQTLGLINGKIAAVTNDDNECIEKLAEQMSDAQFITVFYGEQVKDDEAQHAVEIIKEKSGTNAEITLICGGQPIYGYIISVE